jgi:hypothetical protein
MIFSRTSLVLQWLLPCTWAGTNLRMKVYLVFKMKYIKYRFLKGIHSVTWNCELDRAFFNYITTGAFTPVGPLLAPVVKQDFQMNWAHLIISKKSTLLKNLPALSYPLTFWTFHLIKVRTGRCGATGGRGCGCGGWNTSSRQVVSKLTKIFECMTLIKTNNCS